MTSCRLPAYAPRMLARTFVRPEGFNVERFAAGSISGVLHGTQTTEVRVRFAARVAKAAAAAGIVADREVAHSGDGAVEILYRVADVEELIRWVLGWGSQAEIVAPSPARRRIGELSKEIAAKYARRKK